MNKSSSVFTSNDPGALSVDQILAGVSKDDQEEWEYEYSSTETEVGTCPNLSSPLVAPTNYYYDASRPFI